MRVALGRFRVAFEDLVDVGVGHAFGGADDDGRHPCAGHAAGGVEVHNGANHQTVFARLERAHAVGERFGKHWDGAVDKVDGVAAEAGFAVERGFGRDVLRDVGDVHLQEPAAVFAALDVNGIVEIAGGFAVNGDDGQ